ncbi:MAG: DUF1573 domain-containing protein [Sphingobacteriales bacterium]|nr:DUF1573 domain-containing protein [Sphingobacteriales bacterium]
MKKLFVVISVAISIIACTTTDKKSDDQKSREDFVKDSMAAAEKMKLMNDTADFTNIQWLDSTSIDLGKIKEGKQVEVSYRFKNTGDKPLVVVNVSASCGCTIPEKPEQPIAPGEEGIIKAKFDSKNRKGPNEKHINVDANTKPSPSHILSFKVEVE